MSSIRLKADECLVSLAIENEIPLADLESANQELIKKRQLANCTIDGDTVEIPD